MAAHSTRCARSGQANNEPPAEILSVSEGSQLLADIFVKVLQVITHGHHELVGVRAIDNAVIVAHGETDNVPHGNRIIAVFIGHNHRFLEDTAHSQNRYLRLQDDGQTELRTVDSRIGDGDGAALYVVRYEFLVARALAQVNDGALQSDKAQVLRAFYHGHNQPPVESDSNPDVYILVILNSIAYDRRVDDRLHANSMQQSLGDKRQVRELHAIARFPALAV